MLVDGVDVRDYDIASYRHQLGVVPQEPYLSPGTVRDAIAYGRPGATDAEVEVRGPRRRCDRDDRQAARRLHA